MRLKMSLVRPGGEIEDLLVTVDAVATVGDLAGALAVSDPTADPQSRSGPLTLRRHGEGPTGAAQLLEAELSVVDAGLRSGVTVSLAPRSEQFSIGPAGPAAAVLTVLAGPGAGSRYDLPTGSTYVGREHGCDVRLDDPMVSKRHVRITVAEVVEVVDLGSANGVSVDGGQVQRAVLRNGDTLVLGDTTLSVTRLERPAALAGSPGAPAVAFNRSPRVLTPFPGEEIVAPDPPGRPQEQRLPVIALFAPLLLGAVMYAVTRSVLTLVFVGLSPLLMLGTFVDARRATRRTSRAEAAVFAEAMSATDEQLTSLREVERQARLAETPSTSDVAAAVAGLTPLLWSRRQDAPGFLSLRLGTGTQASRTTVRLPSSNSTTREHWASVQDLAARHATVDDVPVVVDLQDTGALGVAGRSEVALAVARGLVLQLTGLHSPAELAVTGLASTSSSAVWEWLKWLPHVGSAHSPLSGSHLASSPSGASALLTQLEELVEERSAERDRTDAGLPLPAVLVVIHDDSPAERSRLVQLAERGPQVGVFVLWVASAVERLPAVCRSFLDVGSTDGAVAGFVTTGVTVSPVRCEQLGPEAALAAARRLAPVDDAGARVDDSSDLPRSVSVLGLLGPEHAEGPEAVLERWHANASVHPRDGRRPQRRSKDGTLRALVGQSASGPCYLDLRTQGPHALVGGTTGAGKSEFLQSWVLGMAAAYSPDRVTFLFVDYKGGSAFADCVQLPHCVGLVTDLSPHLVRRALTSLKAELKHREHVLNRKSAKDLLTLEREGDPEAPPSLVIVVDEFAALAKEVPEFVDGVVDVAQRGRSLGLHLILATQRPAGVIKDNLRANTNLRVALRMADADDSTDVLGLPVAAGFDPSIPGRGAVKTGPGRLEQFQSAYAGGWTTGEPPPPRIDVEQLQFGQGAVWEAPQDDQASMIDDPGPTDISRLVQTVIEASAAAAVPPPRRPWQDVLSSASDLALLLQRSDDDLALGVQDLPADQVQSRVGFLPDRDGNLAVFGTGGAGKSAVLRTLALSAAITPRGGPCHVYGLDFGSGGLAMLDELPHVGAIITGEDHERTARLLKWLRGLVEERSARYAQVRASTIGEYRELAGTPTEPRILLMVDGLATFRSEYELTSRGTWWSVFQQIAMDGRPVGVHVVVSADRPGTVPVALGASVQRRVVLRLADASDYGLIDVPDDVLGPTSPPGRAVVDGLETQVALLGGSTNVAEQARAVVRLSETVRRLGIPAAPPIERLAERITLSSLPVAVDGKPVIGVADDTLQPVGVVASGVLLVAGPPGAGRTTALGGILSSVRRAAPDTVFHYLGNRRSPLLGLPVWSSTATTVDEVADSAVKLLDELAGDLAPGQPPVCVVLEGVTDFLGGMAEMDLTSLVALCRSQEHFLLADGETSALAQSWPLVQAVKAARRGIALQPDQLDGDTLFRTTFARMSRAEFPPGRGVLVEGGKTRRIQLVLPE